MKYLGTILLASVPLSAHAGLYYSGETPAELPSQWRGFLLDHRMLRMVGVPPTEGTPLHLLRQQYEEAVRRIEEQSKAGPLPAEQSADLGALYIRLGQPGKALEVLRKAQRDYPTDHRVAGNLGTAWQLQGDLNAAARALDEAARLAPPLWRPYEQAQARLVRLRLKDPPRSSTLDDLFGIGPIGPKVRNKLPADDVATVQQLALWLPADGRLLWLLGELAHAHGDVRTAAAILEGVVSEFAITTAEAREKRQTYRAEADEIAKLPDREHARFRGDIVFKSIRPVGRTLDDSILPAIRPDGVNPLPWAVLSETVVDRPFVPRFHKHLKQLDGRRVSLTGFMQPVTMDVNVSGFLLIEYPIGCWFCETPEPAGLLYIEIADGKTVPVKRGRVKVEGTLRLNSNDPEDFLYTVTAASVRDPD